jgi:hypothetical protein
MLETSPVQLMSKIETTVSVDWRIFLTNHFTIYLLNSNRSPINGNFKVIALRSTSNPHWYSEARMVTTRSVHIWGQIELFQVELRRHFLTSAPKPLIHIVVKTNEGPYRQGKIKSEIHMNFFQNIWIESPAPQTSNLLNISAIHFVLQIKLSKWTIF